VRRQHPKAGPGEGRPRVKGHIDTHRLALTRRIAELPILLMQGPRSQIELARLYEVSQKTIWRDIKVLSAYWPIHRLMRGPVLWYELAPDARPLLPRIGQRQAKE